MEEKRTSLFENGLIWFGAGVSIAEILTGTYLAPLGFGKGLAAILLGHVIGCLMMFFAGVIGARNRKSAMETVKLSFGQRGGLLFAILNVLQLVGWTGIMIYDGALAADSSFGAGAWVWCIVIGALIILWIAVGGDKSGEDQYHCHGCFVHSDDRTLLGDLLQRRRSRNGKRGDNEFWSSSRTVCGNASLLAPGHQRLYKRGREAGEGDCSQCDRLRPGELLDVYYRNGSSRLYGRV